MSVSSSAFSHCFYIGIGSNLGESRQIILQAWNRLGQHPAIRLTALSHPYLTRPVGMESEHLFVNAAGSGRTSLSPTELLRLLQSIEKEHGRTRSAPSLGYQDRTLDLDLLLYDDLILVSSLLTVPHPRMLERLFVLEPLAEIATTVHHPLTGRSIGAQCTALAQQETGGQRIEWDS